MAALLPLMLLVWAVAMTAKMVLNLHIFHYGFALAMPATLVGIVLLIGWLPAWIDRIGGCGWVLRSAAVATLLVVIWAHGHAFALYWSRKTIIVGNGGDAFLADPRGKIIDRVVSYLNASVPPGATLAVMPEGLTVNYFSRRENPTGQLNFTPPAIIMYGEDQMLAAVQAHPPDYLLLTNIDASEYGATAFGVDYAMKLTAWLDKNYDAQRTFVGEAFGGPAVRMLLMKKSKR